MQLCDVFSCQNSLVTLVRVAKPYAAGGIAGEMLHPYLFFKKFAKLLEIIARRIAIQIVIQIVSELAAGDGGKRLRAAVAFCAES